MRGKCSCHIAHHWLLLCYQPVTELTLGLVTQVLPVSFISAAVLVSGCGKAGMAACCNVTQAAEELDHLAAAHVSL